MTLRYREATSEEGELMYYGIRGSGSTYNFSGFLREKKRPLDTLLLRWDWSDSAFSGRWCWGGRLPWDAKPASSSKCPWQNRLRVGLKEGLERMLAADCGLSV